MAELPINPMTQTATPIRGQTPEATVIIGHIGARQGSQGVPGKNFRAICGRPLIDWSLDQLFSSPDVDVVVVSTDSPEIYQHARSRGALDIGLRPKHLATETAGKWDVWVHALQAAERLTGPAQVFLDIDCTSPLRKPEDISSALALFRSEKPDMVMNCSEARVNPYFNLLEADETGALHVSKPLPGGVVARQQAPIVYQHAALTYVLSPAYLKRASSLFEGRVIPNIVPPERSMDIDSEIDFEIVETLLQRQLDQSA